MLIEKIRLGMVPVLAERGLSDLELTVFDTHGESIGRGAHPGGIADRLRYYDTPESRRRFAAAGIQVREESSFQGGDGFLYFLTPDSAFAVACNSRGVKTVAAGFDVSLLAPAHLGDVLVATAVERSLRGRSGIYDVTVTRGDEVVAEFRGRSRALSA